MSEIAQDRSRSKRLSQRLSGAVDTIFPLKSPSKSTGKSPVMIATNPDSTPPLPSGISPDIPPPATVAPAPAPVSAPTPASKHANCTHMTMTRLYSKEFRCAVCSRESSLGWVYRCTQDRELILEDDIGKGLIEKLDALSEIFESRTSPPNRSPAARQNPAAFLKELTDGQYKTYSRDQLNTILAQRVLILETAARETAKLNSTVEAPVTPPHSLFSDRKSTDNPWLPFYGGECQFKCCHRCRPSSKERSFLSLNGIANGDLPMTAVTGFGFHLQGHRPVLKADVVKNLGLRDNPPTSGAPENAVWSFSSLSSTLISPSKAQFDLSVLRKNKLTGLGVTSNDDSIRPATPFFPPGLPIPKFFPHQNMAATSNGSAHDPSIQKGFAELFQSKPHQSRNTRNLVGRTKTPNNLSPKNRTGYFDRPLPPLPAKKSSSTLNLAIGIALPKMMGEETENATQPCTPMEMVEAKTGWFGSKPLAVRDGVAVTEESVEGHFADLAVNGAQSVISQF